MPLPFNVAMPQLLIWGQLLATWWNNQGADMTLGGKAGWHDTKEGVIFEWNFSHAKFSTISGTGEGRDVLWGDAKIRMRGMYRNTEQDNIPLNEVASIYPYFTKLRLFFKGASMECEREDWDQRGGSKKEKVLLRDPLLVGQVSSPFAWHPATTQCTMQKLQWEFGHRIFSFLREKFTWNIWTWIKWEGNLSEIFGRG